MIQPMESIDIRVGTPEDAPAIIEFALALSEDAFTSRDRWYKICQDKTIYPLIAVYNQNIVGKIQARIVGEFGWLESARVSPDFRKMGVAHTLVDAAMDWLIENGVNQVRTQVDSDNMAARKIVERHHFRPKFLTINPSVPVHETDANPDNIAEFAPVLDEQQYDYFSQMTAPLGGNIMYNGLYLPFTKSLMKDLIAERRIYTNASQNMLLIISYHNLPSEVHGFLLAKTINDYALGGKALKAFAGRELATICICHSPSRRDAVVGLSKEGYAWGQPHTLMIYSRESWQEREDTNLATR